MLRPINTDILLDICLDIAFENYGFIYLNDHSSDIGTRYESEDDRTLNFGSLSTSELREGLREIAQEHPQVYERREGTSFYFDPFAFREGERVMNQLTDVVFETDLVVNKQNLRSTFNLAPDDVDFYINELTSRGFLQRIAGEYFTIGDSLEDETDGKISVANKLMRGAKRGTRNGLISHSDLERVINVAATQDVIDHLVDNNFIIDLDDSYLVIDAINEFGEYLASECGDDIVGELEDSSYIMTDEEFKQVVENEIRARSEVLSKVDRDTYDRILEETIDYLKTNAGIEITRSRHDTNVSLVVLADKYEERATESAERIITDIEREHGGTPPAADIYRKEAEPHVADLTVGTETENEHFRAAVTEELDDQIAPKFDPGSDDT